MFETAHRRRVPGALICSAVHLGLALGWPAPNVLAASPSPSEHTESYTFAFQDADVKQVVAEILGKALGLSYTIDPSISSKISFEIDKKLTGSQLLEALEAVLEDSDIALVRQGDTIAVKPRAKAKAGGPVRPLSDGIREAGYQTLAVPLEFATPSELAKALQAVTGEDMVVYVDDKIGLLVLGGSQTQLQSAIETIRLFDRSELEDSKIRFFDLEQAATQTVATDLDRIVQSASLNGVMIVPLRRLNALFVVAKSSAVLTQIAGWVRRLDVPSREKTLSLWVYHPRNLSADSLSAALNGVMGIQSNAMSVLPGSTSTGSAAANATSGYADRQQSSAANSTPASPGIGGSPSPPPALSSLSSEDDPVRISVDKQSNTLLFSASQTHWIQIQKALNDLDQTPSQVLIEASILEVTLNNTLNHGVDWSSLGANGRLTVSSINSAAGTIGQSIPGFSATFLGKDIQAAVSALSERTVVEVISAPKIIALDNQPAKLEVGDSVPITTQSAQSTSAAGAPIVNSVDYRNTGIILNVTPRISGDGRVMLDISQEVSSVSQSTSAATNSPTIQQRKLSTILMLPNGGVVALGGLISNNRTVSNTGIPYVQSIPLFGGLFKTQRKSIARTELIVLLTVSIIRDQSNSDRATSQLIKDMKEIRSRDLIEH